MIRESFLRFIYQAASMQRWNDHIRPTKGFTELDKQAHKLYYAYVLGKLEEETCPIDWMKLMKALYLSFSRGYSADGYKACYFPCSHGQARGTDQQACDGQAL